MSKVINSFLDGARTVLNPFNSCNTNQSPIDKFEMTTPQEDVKNIRNDWFNLKKDLESAKNKTLQNG